MSLISSLYSGVSGMTNYAEAMSVVGDNLANTNTNGFKSSSVTFADLIASKTTGHQIGRGNQLSAVSVSQQQGSFQTTQSSTDVALEGKGYFVVEDTLNGTGKTFYSRAGNFTLDSTGYLVDPNSNYVQGYVYNPTTQGFATAPTPMLLNNQSSSPNPTSTMTMGLNLDAAASAGASFQSSLTAYNSLGDNITVSINFNKSLTTPGEWSYNTVASIGTAVSSGTLTFNNLGVLVSHTPGGAGGVAGTTNPTINITNFPGNGTGTNAADLAFNWNMFDGNGLSLGDVSQFSSQSAVSTITQDGFSTGDLTGLNVDSFGIVNGTFTNGQVQPLAKLTLADFASPWQLDRAGSSLWTRTQAAGEPIYGTASAGSFGSILGSSLEMSTTDMATEFTNMIQFQRAYQSSSKIVTTTDQMLQDAINLVR